MNKRSEKQQAMYDLLSRQEFEFYEELPAKGLICMRKEHWFGTESMSYDYITIKKDGNVVSGNILF